MFTLVRQYDTMDCGPDCLCMVTKHYGKNFELKYFRHLSSITKQGVSLFSISKAAEKVGFCAVPQKITFDGLVQKATLPCIIHWDQEHFLVVYKIKKCKKGCLIYVADPARGLLTYSEQEFCQHWIITDSDGDKKGVALILEPTVHFYEQKEKIIEKQKRIKFLWKYFIKYKRFFTQLILGLIIGSFIQLLFPFFTQAIVDVGVLDKDINFIWLILIAEMGTHEQLILTRGKYYSLIKDQLELGN